MLPYVLFGHIPAGEWKDRFEAGSLKKFTVCCAGPLVVIQ
jgi:hypothetical protein